MDEIHYNQNVLICLILKENGTGYPDNKNVYTFQISYKHWAGYKLFFTSLKNEMGQKAEIAGKLMELYFPGNIHNCPNMSADMIRQL